MLGSEGEGLRRRVAESCDVLVSIPVRGQVGSLNVSAAAAVLLFEAVRQRGSRMIATTPGQLPRNCNEILQRPRPGVDIGTH